MIVLKSKYKKLEQDYLALQKQNVKLLNQCKEFKEDNRWRDEVIELLGNCVLNKTTISRLLLVVHPDKHNNEEKFVELTTKLLEVRNSISKLLNYF